MNITDPKEKELADMLPEAIVIDVWSSVSKRELVNALIYEGVYSKLEKTITVEMIQALAKSIVYLHDHAMYRKEMLIHVLKLIEKCPLAALICYTDELSSYEEMKKWLSRDTIQMLVWCHLRKRDCMSHDSELLGASTYWD
jgi:hypothetical protein